VDTAKAAASSGADEKPVAVTSEARPAAKPETAATAPELPADKPALDSKSDTSALQNQQAKTDAAVPRAELKTAEARPEIPLKAPEPAPQPVAVAAPAALNAAATTQAANAVAGNQLQARVGSQAWDQQLGQKVVWMVAGGDQSATLTLNPPDLGPLQVVLNVSNDQASASFTAAQPEVRQALENAMPKLKEMMGEAGIQLGQTSVSAGDPGQQQQAFAEASGRSSGGRGNGSGPGGSRDNGADTAQPVPATPRRSILGAVDTFA